MIDQMEFNVLRRAQAATKSTNSLDNFFGEQGIDIRQVRKHPEYYEELLMQYSRDCISQELYKESREQMKDEFNRLCEFHRRNEENLIEKFYSIAKSIIREEIGSEQLQVK